MGRRTGRRVKPATKLSIPGVIFAVIPEVWHDPRHTAEGAYFKRWVSAQVAVCYRRRGKWSNVQERSVLTPGELRETLDEWAIQGRLNWVIAPSAADLLTLSRWWDYAEASGVSFDLGERRKRTAEDRGSDRGGVRLHQIVCSGRTDIIQYTQRGIAWRFLGARNYWPDGCATTGDATTDTGPGGSGPAGGVHVQCGREASEAGALLVRFRGLCHWWQRIATAPLGCTASQLAWGVLRSDPASALLCTHACPDTHRLERASAHGGRASVFYAHEVLPADDAAPRSYSTGGVVLAAPERGPITHVDVSSMYPSILRDESFPLSLRSVRGAMRPADVFGLADGGGVIARVTIKTRAAEYPLRRGDRTVYPLGEFTTTLAGPDLKALAHDGEIVAVHQVAIYNMGRPFKGAMDKLLGDRERAKACHDKDAQAFSKLVANSLGGRLAMNVGGWERYSERDEPGRWGEYHSLSTTVSHSVRYRYLLGACWRWDADKEGAGPHTSAFAYLTAYGRQMMRRLRDTLPEKSVVSQDTDGLYLLPRALDALKRAGSLERAGPGQLRITGSADSGQWYAPRHYRIGDRWVLSGFSPSKLPDADLRFSYACQTPLFGRGDRRAPEAVHTVTRETAVPTNVDLGRIQPDGWVIPPHYVRGKEG